MPAGADFDEYYCIAVEHDQIELSAATGPILAKCGKALSP
ncbi:LOW QUALITY PROTEIN: putative endonuclease [Pseudomonas aeruginosa 39016]|nr:LOW QUALITY PROTEIN: putative endonuclease [Pseudomonas aeruginosa 39016]